MKRGYKRLLLFASILILILLANALIYNVFSSYIMILFLICLLGVFHIFFVLEKDHHRYLGDVLFEILIYVVSFFLLYYLLGLLVGLARTNNYFTFDGIKDFLFPITVYCILREVFRYNMLCKAEGSKICTTVVIILFIMFDLTNNIYYASLDSKFEIIRFIALTLLPIIARNASYSYISRKMGYKPIIIFDLIFTLYPYLIPIIPNPNEYLVSIIYLLVPIIFAFRMLKFFDKKEDYHLPSDYYKKKFKGAIIPALIIIVLVYFYSGYFRFYAIAIASGSMEPEIKKGDVVIVDRNYSYVDLEEGQVIAFKKDNIIVVHRIVKKMKLENSYIYYTKGDANDNIDDLIINQSMVIGKVDYKLSYIGYPTVWISE